MRYIALLRGINVGGNTMIKMSELKAAFENLGFENVVSYVNSGNLAFDTKKTAESKLVSKIEQAVEKMIDKQVLVMVREQSSIKEVLEHDPSAHERRATEGGGDGQGAPRRERDDSDRPRGRRGDRDRDGASAN